MTNICNQNRAKKRRRIYLRDMGVCQLCLKWVDFDQMTLDHKLPKAKGGTRDDDNLQVSHLCCNIIKSDNTEILNPKYFITHPDYNNCNHRIRELTK